MITRNILINFGDDFDTLIIHAQNDYGVWIRDIDSRNRTTIRIELGFEDYHSLVKFSDETGLEQSHIDKYLYFPTNRVT